MLSGGCLGYVIATLRALGKSVTRTDVIRVAPIRVNRNCGLLTTFHETFCLKPGQLEGPLREYNPLGA